MRKTIIMIAAAVLTACGGQTRQDSPANKRDSVAISTPTPSTSLDSLAQTNAVRTMGKVVAARFADLSFETALPIERVLVRNGQQVRRGQALAMLDQYKLRNAIEQQQRAIDQAQLQIDHSDVLRCRYGTLKEEIRRDHR